MAGRDGARDALVGVEQGDAAVVIALDLEALAGVDQEALLVGLTGRPVAEIVDLHFVSCAVDHCIGSRGLAAEAEKEIAERHHDGAELHRPFRAEILVGEEAADQRRQIDERGIAAVEAGRLAIAEDEMLGEIERQQRPHAVIAEPLPRFGREQPGQRPRMAEPGLFRRRIDVADVRFARGIRGGRVYHRSCSPKVVGGLRPPSLARRLKANFRL